MNTSFEVREEVDLSRTNAIKVPNLPSDEWFYCSLEVESSCVVDSLSSSIVLTDSWKLHRCDNCNSITHVESPNNSLFVALNKKTVKMEEAARTEVMESAALMHLE